MIAQVHNEAMFTSPGPQGPRPMYAAGIIIHMKTTKFGSSHKSGSSHKFAVIKNVQC